MARSCVGRRRIGPEVVAQARRSSSGAPECSNRMISCVRYTHRRGAARLGLQSCRARRDPAGAVGDPTVRRACWARAAAQLRFAFDQYVNLRPSLSARTSSAGRRKLGEVTSSCPQGQRGLYRAPVQPAPGHPLGDRHREANNGTGGAVDPVRVRAGPTPQLRKVTWCNKPTAHPRRLPLARTFDAVAAEHPDVITNTHVDRRGDSW